MISYYQFTKDVFFVQEMLMEKYVLEVRHLGITFRHIYNQSATEIILRVNAKHV